MSNPEEEEPDYDSDESWYEEAMNALDSPANNHGAVYSEEEIADLSDFVKGLIRYRNQILQNGFEFIDLQNGDYINDVISRSATINYPACSFVIAYKKEGNYLLLFQFYSEDETVVNPVQLAAFINVGKHLGSYKFIEFFHLKEELDAARTDLNGIKINLQLTYKEKPSLEFYSSDDIKLNKQYVERMEQINPEIFEFLNEYIILELPHGSTTEKYFEIIKELEH